MWGKGYKEGFYAAFIRFNPECTLEGQALTDHINKYLYADENGQPTRFAVANHCCGGVDAHTPGCRTGGY